MWLYLLCGFVANSVLFDVYVFGFQGCFEEGYRSYDWKHYERAKCSKGDWDLIASNPVEARSSDVGEGYKAYPGADWNGALGSDTPSADEILLSSEDWLDVDRSTSFQCQNHRGGRRRAGSVLLGLFQLCYGQN